MITPAYSCLIPTDLQLPCCWANLFHSLWDVGHSVTALLSLWEQPTTYQPMLNSTWASKNPTTGEVAAFQPWILARISPSRLLLRTIFTRPGYLLLTYWSRLNFSSTARQKKTHTNIQNDKSLAMLCFTFIYSATERERNPEVFLNP